MEKKEKVEFILEQMRLCLAKKDYIRTSIISKKINTRFFTTTEDVDVSSMPFSVAIMICIDGLDLLPCNAVMPMPRFCRRLFYPQTLICDELSTCTATVSPGIPSYCLAM